jgi:phage gp45-like
MSNIMNNGAVLPSGLLGVADADMMAGFNKTYKNNALRIGVVVASYPTSNDKNRSKLTTEYDVLVVEQQENKGTTTLLYRNCMSSEGLGSIADFFEKALRPKKKKTTKGDSVNLKGQDGAIVLLLCLDSMSDKGIIISALTHPDRKTTLKDEGPRLEGEYNGLNIKVEKDGSATLTFRGATGNDGNVLDKEQGDTVIGIEKDGSFQIKVAKEKGVTQRFDKKGKASLTAEDDISNTTKKNFNVTATENVEIKATKNFTLDCKDLVAKASGSAILECQKLTIKSQSEVSIKGREIKMEAEAMAKIKSTLITLDGLVNLGGDGGQPVLILTSLIMGVGNLGAPVISQAITGAFKVNAQ